MLTPLHSQRHGYVSIEVLIASDDGQEDKKEGERGRSRCQKCSSPFANYW